MPLELHGFGATTQTKDAPAKTSSVANVPIVKQAQANVNTTTAEAQKKAKELQDLKNKVAIEQKNRFNTEQKTRAAENQTLAAKGKK